MLSCNYLIDTIPLELEQLQGIHSLNFSHNQLTDSTPKILSNLAELESLDLSHDSLSGEIPPQLLELTFSVVFSVAYRPRVLKHNLELLTQAAMKEIHFFMDSHWRKIALGEMIHLQHQCNPQMYVMRNGMKQIKQSSSLAFQ